MKFNLLIVDDEKYILEDIISLIDKDALHIGMIYTALNATKATEILTHESVSIVLSDIEMPGESGLDLIENIKKMFPEIPCILLTCHADFSYAQRAVQLGVQDYLLKLVEYEDLAHNIFKAESKLLNSYSHDNTILNSNKECIEEQYLTDNDEKHDYVAEASIYIQQHIKEDITREDVAKIVFLTADHLDRLFKQKYGLSIRHYILQTKMNLATELLRTTDLPISYIASQLAFSNMSNFASSFKKEMGVSPNEYRKLKDK